MTANALADRIQKAVVECQNLQARRRDLLVTTQARVLLTQLNEDIARLGGKVEGLQLALSYLYDQERLDS